MTVAGGVKGPATELSQGLIDALVRIPITSTTQNRRLLISLVRRDFARYPDVQELPESRLHIINIVVACLEHPAALWALRDALTTMAPDEAGTRRACQLIDSAGLSSLVPEDELRQCRELIRQAGNGHDQVDWQGLVENVAPHVAGKSSDLVSAFDQLAVIGPGQGRSLPALTFVAGVTTSVGEPVAGQLRMWLQEQIERFGVSGDELLLPSDPLPDAANGVPPEGDGRDRINMGAGAAHDVPIAGILGESDKPGISDGQPDDEQTGDTGDNMVSAAPTKPPARRLPRVWGDVPPRNPNFTGREELLSRLHKELLTVREAAVLPQALHGMGGVGKSQLAIEYVHRHSSEYDLVWWISAEQNILVLSSLVKLAQRLGLDVSPEANSAVPAVQDALNTGKIEYERWLLVFDNAESIEEVRPYFPTGGAGKILVTSRNPEWAGVARALEVDVFTRAESKAFLTNRTPELTDNDADRLAEALGDLPLAVEQAASWRAATGMPVDEYLGLLEEKRIELLDDTSSSGYQKNSVAAAWNVSLDRLDKVNRSALHLLQVCSFFSPEPISREFFRGSAVSPITDPLDQTLRDSVKLGRAIRDIQRFALAKLNHQNNTLQIHRLIQTVIIGRMDESQRELMRAGAHALLASANPHSPGRHSRWGVYQSLLPHVQASGAVDSTDPNVMDLVFETVQFLFHWGDHEGCLEFAENAYKSWLAKLGENHAEVLRLAKYLGWIRSVVGRYDEAVEIFERSLKLYTDQFGEEDENALDAMLMVAYARRIKGDFAGARQVDERAHPICHRLFGEDDPVTLRAANSLGVSLRLNGEFKQAAELDKKTHLSRQEVLGSDDSDTLLTLNNLIIDTRESGEFVKASRQQEEALERSLAAFQYPDNPTVMRASRNLAVAQRKAGEHTRALELSLDTVERYRRRYGDDYPDTMSASLNLAIDSRHAGNLDEARKLGEKTLQRYRSILGEQHPHTLAAQVNLAIVIRQLGDAQGAYRSDRESLDALSERLGPDHPSTLTCATNLASDLFAMGDAQAAFDLDTDTLARSERILGVEHPSTLAVGVNLALDLRALGREQEADLLHADNMARFRRSLGDQHPATLNALKSLRADCDIDPMPL